MAIKRKHKKREPSKLTDHPVAHKQKDGQLLRMPIKDLEPDSGQARTKFDDKALKNLSETIKERGILQPIIVRYKEAGIYQIVAGERRYRAAIMADLKEIPCVVTTSDDYRLISLIENLQREDLDPMDEAMGYKRMMEEYEISQSDLARMIGKSRQTISAVLTLLKIPEDVVEKVSCVQDKISKRILIDTAKEEPEVQRQIIDNIINKGYKSPQIREERQKRTQTINRSSAEEILSRKIQAVIKALDGLESSKRLKRPIVKELRDLQNKLNTFLR